VSKFKKSSSSLRQLEVREDSALRVIAIDLFFECERG
jgi:hypothetical protein